MSREVTVTGVFFEDSRPNAPRLSLRGIRCLSVSSETGRDVKWVTRPLPEILNPDPDAIYSGASKLQVGPIQRTYRLDIYIPNSYLSVRLLHGIDLVVKFSNGEVRRYPNVRVVGREWPDLISPESDHMGAIVTFEASSCFIDDVRDEEK